MTTELAQLLGSLKAIGDASDNKEVQAIAKALVRYFESTKNDAGFSGKIGHE